MRRTGISLVLLAAAAGAAEDKILAKIAGIWIEEAQWQAERGSPELARKAFEHARLAGAAEEAPPEGAGEGGAAAEKRFQRTAAQVAKLYDQLGKDQIRYLFRAIELEPSARRISAALAQAKRAPPAEAGLILAQLREVDAEHVARYDAAEIDLARQGMLLIRGAGHPMAGWLSLPRGWREGGEYPVLVAVEGAGSNFEGAAKGFASARGSRDVIVLTPCSLSSTNELKPEMYPCYAPETLREHDGNRIEFDLAGLDALLAVVRERYGGTGKLAVTGFSGGGNLCYALCARKPAGVALAVPACANFTGAGFGGARPGEGAGPAIRILTGEKDPHRHLTHGKTPPGIEEQTDRAVEALQRLGLTDVTRTMLPGVGHSPCRKEVWDLFDEVVK